MSLMLVIFWGSIALIIFTYAIFPVIVYIRGLLFPHKYKQDNNYKPSVSLIIAAYNEEENILKKINNIKSLDYYDRQNFEVIIASDGSTDLTNELVANHANNKIRLLKLSRSGKADTLNDAVAQSRGDILVFSDANSLYVKDAIDKLVRNFADEKVGGVAGNQQYSTTIDGQNDGEVVYWNFDTSLKKWQGKAGNAIAATGAIYAIRRSLFIEVPQGVTDDFVTSTRVISQGSRLVYDQEAVAFEQVAENQKKEFRRKVRIMTRGLYAVFIMRELLNPFEYGFYSFQLFVHKLLRRLLYIPLIVMFLANMFLLQEHWFYQLTMFAQVVFYTISIVGWQLAIRDFKLPKAISIMTFGCMVYAAALLATWNVLTGQKIVTWSTHRQM